MRLVSSDWRPSPEKGTCDDCVLDVDASTSELRRIARACVPISLALRYRVISVYSHANTNIDGLGDSMMLI
jgi:hypothetical protein